MGPKLKTRYLTQEAGQRLQQPLVVSAKGRSEERPRLSQPAKPRCPELGLRAFSLLPAAAPINQYPISDIQYPISNTQYPIPNTQYPTPYALRPTPYAPTLYTLHPTPYTLGLGDRPSSLPRRAPSALAPPSELPRLVWRSDPQGVRVGRSAPRGVQGSMRGAQPHGKEGGGVHVGRSAPRGVHVGRSAPRWSPPTLGLSGTFRG